MNAFQIAAERGFQIGDKVTRGNGKKVLEITNFREANSQQNDDSVYAALNGGTLYPLNSLKKA